MRPAMINGMIQRTDDVGYLKQQQDNKPMHQQMNVQNQMVKKQDELRHQVMNTEHGNKTDTHTDAREEGKGTYFVRKKKKTNQSQEPQEEVVVKKTGGSSFDIKI